MRHAPDEDATEKIGRRIALLARRGEVALADRQHDIDRRLGRARALIKAREVKRQHADQRQPEQQHEAHLPRRPPQRRLIVEDAHEQAEVVDAVREEARDGLVAADLGEPVDDSGEPLGGGQGEAIGGRDQGAEGTKGQAYEVVEVSIEQVRLLLHLVELLRSVLL